ncbi:MAG: phosphoglycerate mutase [Rhodopirellula sp. TMED11]|nr:MAG: phosphoglycerate mutase [Rhodopirellula sp. TMED11]
MSSTATLTRLLLVQPGPTEFDEQGRLKGSLDMPLSEAGFAEANAVASQLCDTPITMIYAAPCESAQQTAALIAAAQPQGGRLVKTKVMDAFQNINQGLWHGKLIEEIKRNHPRVYRQGAEHPLECAAPEGESLGDVQNRIQKALKKCLKRARDETVALVVPNPLASMIRSQLTAEPMPSVWNHCTDTAKWEVVQTEL